MKKLLSLIFITLSITCNAQKFSDAKHYPYMGTYSIGSLKAEESANSGKAKNITVATVVTSKAVDLGLPSGTVWAGYNIGATAPEQKGAHFAWGETKSKKSFDWDNYFDVKGTEIETVGYTNITKYVFNDYNSNGGKLSLKKTKDDTATAIWGEEWSMPTQAQFEELFYYCTWKKTKYKGVNGFIVNGPNGKSIFLPAAGEIPSSNFAGNVSGCYACSELRNVFNSDSYLYYGIHFIIDTNDQDWFLLNWDTPYRCVGVSVRAVKSSDSAANKAKSLFETENTSTNTSTNSNSANKFCTQCGNKVSANDNFCGNCGKKLK